MVSSTLQLLLLTLSPCSWLGAALMTPRADHSHEPQQLSVTVTEDTAVSVQSALAFRVSGLAHPERPRMLVMSGCSGSSFLLNMASGLLEAHGAAVNTPGGGELTKPSQNPFYKPSAGMGVAMEAAYASALQSNATLVFKEQGARSSFFQDSTPLLLKLNTYVVHGFRENAIDRMVCLVKDCFVNETFGVPVYHGDESDMCFARRKLGRKSAITPGDYKARLNTTHLASNLLQALEDPKLEKTRIDAAGFRNTVSLSTEALLDFEHDSSALDSAVEAWSHFLEAWGVRPETQSIRNHLSKYVGRFTAEPHRDTIYNFQEVADIVAHHSELRPLLRA